MSQSRQLAAIMFTDIVGYTALMGEDEQKAFELLKKNRAVQRPLIEKFNGRWLKEIGDGVLTSFSSVSDAVNCAKEIQKTCQTESDLNLRIGIHQGEVVFEGNDVFGDGVNIASRLEPLAPIGGIIVSEAVNNNLVNKKDIESILIGEKELRGVKVPVKVYNVTVEGVTPSEAKIKPSTSLEVSPRLAGIPRKKTITILGILIVLVVVFIVYTGQKRTSSDIELPIDIINKSIAIIPFKNLSSEKDSEYFSDGMMDAILSHLSKIGDLRVISRTSMEQYRDSPKTIPQIGSELNVAYILEGSVQRYEDEVRIIVQLIDANMDEHIWSETYDRELKEIFKVQSEIARNIALELKAELSAEDEMIMEKKPTRNLTAYDLYLKGRQFHTNWRIRSDSRDLEFAINFYKKAIELDSNFYLAKLNLGFIFIDKVVILGEDYVLLDSALIIGNELIKEHPERTEALTLLGRIYRFGDSSNYWHNDTSKALAKELLIESVSYNPNDPVALNSLAVFFWSEENRNDLALILRQRALTLEPLNIESHAFQCGPWVALNDYDKAEEALIRALELQPDFVYGHVLLGVIYSLKMDTAKVLSALEQTISYNPDGLRVLYLIGVTYANVGEFEKSKEYLLQTKNTNYWVSEQYAYTLWNLGRKQEAQQYFEEAIENYLQFIEYGLDVSYSMASLYAFMGEKEKSYYWLEKMVENNNFINPDFLKKDPFFYNLTNDENLKKYLQIFNHRMFLQLKNYEELKELSFNEIIERLDEYLID